MYFCSLNKNTVMSCLLHIETSTPVCSVALSADGEVIFEKTSFNGPSHAALAGVFTEEALSVVKAKALKLQAVAVSSGPGSYTGLRIGVSLAKGLCFGYGIPLIAIPTLELLAWQARQTVPAETGSLYCAMLDARRMEVYAALYDAGGKLVRPAAADILSPDAYAPFLETHKVYFSGNGASKCKDVITSPNAVFLEDIHPLAAAMVALADESFAAGKFEDTAYFEPFYLKEFQPTVPRNKVF
jgi:tRNA threonylcarbamoyladenosine biosynthesis protein TsaB